MFPDDAVTLTFHVVGPATSTLLSVPNGQTYTILGIYLDNSDQNAGDMDWIQYSGATCADTAGSTSTNCYLGHLSAKSGAEVYYETEIKATSTLNYITEGTSNSHHYIALTYVARDTAQTNHYASYQTGLLIVVAGLLFIDLFRRMFSRHSR